MPTHAELADRAELTDLVARLSRWLDSPPYDVARAAGLYAPHVVAHTVGGTLRGRDAVLAHLNGSRPAGERTQHFHTDLLIAPDGDRAEITAHELVLFFREGAPPHRRAGVRVAYAAERGRDGWRLAGVRVTPAWIAG
jgi:ketosteroid isomerase-like protein